MSDLPFRDLAKLQEHGFYASEAARNKAIDQTLLRLYRDAYVKTTASIAKLYAKVGLETPLQTPSGPVFIRKEDAIRYKQLDNLLTNLADEMVKLRHKGVTLTEETSAMAIQDGYYRNVWAYDQAVGVRLGIPALPIAAIRASVYSEVSGLDLVKTWAKNTTAGNYATRSAIMRGITNGYSYTKVARSIKTEFDKGLWQALRVVRTEAGRCWSEGAEDAHNQAQEAGLVTKKRWSAALDKRTRPSHAALDGEYADEDGMFELGGELQPQPRMFSDPAESVNCRCSTYDVIDGIEPSVRRVRNDSGKGSQILPYQTFEQWAAPKGWTAAKGWPKVQSTPNQKATAIKTQIPKAMAIKPKVSAQKISPSALEDAIKERIGRTTREERDYIALGTDARSRELRMDWIKARKDYENYSGPNSEKVRLRRIADRAIVAKREYGQAKKYDKAGQEGIQPITIKGKIKEFDNGQEFYEYTQAKYYEQYQHENKGAIKEYTETSFKEINEGLRSKNIDKSLNEKMSSISRFINDNPLKDNIKIYRGTDLDINKINIGDSLNFEGFLSFSAKESTAKGYSTQNNSAKYILETIAPKGSKITSIATLSAWQTEAELLADRGMKFLITNITKDESGFTHIIMQLLE